MHVVIKTTFPPGLLEGWVTEVNSTAGTAGRRDIKPPVKRALAHKG